MAKMLLDTELLDIVRRVIEDDEIDDADQYAEFLDQLGDLITQHFGGEVGSTSYAGDCGWLTAIRWNDSVPPGGGIYAKYDTNADFELIPEEYHERHNHHRTPGHPKTGQSNPVPIGTGKKQHHRRPHTPS